MIYNGPKRTIFVSSGLGLLQMVSKLDFGRCASEECWALEGMDCEVPHRLERGTKHSLLGCGNLSLADAF